MSKKGKSRDINISLFLNICILVLFFFIFYRISSINKKLNIEDDILAKARATRAKLEANPIKNTGCPVKKLASCSALNAEQDVCGGKNCCTPADSSKDLSGSGCIPRDCADEFGGCAN